MMFHVNNLTGFGAGVERITPVEFHDVAATALDGSGDATLNYPAGTATGDVLFLVVAKGAFSTTSATPSGWTLIDSVSSGYYWYWRVCGGEASVAIDTSSSAGGAVVAVYKGRAPALGDAASAASGTGTSTNPPAVTGVKFGMAVVGAASSTNSGIGTPSGYTERYDAYLDSQVRVAISDKALSADGTENPASISIGSGLNASNTVAINPE